MNIIIGILECLKGKIDGAAIRVPVSNVSLIDFSLSSSRFMSAYLINKTLIEWVI